MGNCFIYSWNGLGVGWLFKLWWEAKLSSWDVAFIVFRGGNCIAIVEAHWSFIVLHYVCTVASCCHFSCTFSLHNGNITWRTSCLHKDLNRLTLGSWPRPLNSCSQPFPIIHLYSIVLCSWKLHVHVSVQGKFCDVSLTYLLFCLICLVGIRVWT